MQVNTVNIRPGVNVLSVLPHLNYKAWFALAEFVDNSIQSSVDRKKDLVAVDGKNYRLRVDIDFNTSASEIVIKDNAAGISSVDYKRAFRPAEIPPDASGLSEFGMGMKSAACWIAPKWSVRSTALGENNERTVIFDIDEIVNDVIEELDVISLVASENNHYTEVRLENIRRYPRGKTTQKIREHLASIYRVYIRENLLELYVDGQKLMYEEPAILNAPSYRNPDGPSISWKKDIDIDLGDGKGASGFVAIRETASTKLAGLALFRRKRLIMGSVDEAYRPEDIFGRSNTFPYQRIFGEIHLKGFFVSHTKDGIKWEESEDEFLKKLRKEITGDNFPLLQQAREHRADNKAKTIRGDAAKGSQKTVTSLKSSNLTTPSAENKYTSITNEVQDLPESKLEHAEIRLRFRNEDWIVRMELSYSEDETDWLIIHNGPSIIDPEPREITVRVAMLCPFMAQCPTQDTESFATALYIAAAMALSEIAASELGDRNPAVVRRYTNEILLNPMSQQMNDD